MGGERISHHNGICSAQLRRAAASLFNAVFFCFGAQACPAAGQQSLERHVVGCCTGSSVTWRACEAFSAIAISKSVVGLYPDKAPGRERVTQNSIKARFLDGTQVLSLSSSPHAPAIRRDGTPDV